MSKMENRDFVDQRHLAVNRFMTDYKNVLAQRGTIVMTYRRRAGRVLGPYYKLTCRIGGRQAAVYLGNDESLIREVQERLTRLQRPRLEHMQLRTLQRNLRHGAREARRQLDIEIGKLGLVRKGHEIRGWRTNFTGRHVLGSTTADHELDARKSASAED
jgi:hypothetical protein